MLNERAPTETTGENIQAGCEREEEETDKRLSVFSLVFKSSLSCQTGVKWEKEGERAGDDGLQEGRGGD